MRIPSQYFPLAATCERASAAALAILLITACGGSDNTETTPEAMDPDGTNVPPGGSGGGPGGAQGNGGITPATTPGADTYTYNACPDETRVGSFYAGYTKPYGEAAYPSVSGTLRDGVDTSTLPMTVSSEGDCRLVKGNVGDSCDPACPFGESCDDERGCVRTPVQRSGGIVTVSGLEGGPIVMESRSSGGGKYNASGTLPNPIVNEGASITLEATGGEALPAFAIQAEGVAPLVVNEPEVALAPGRAASVTWVPPATPGRSRVLASLNLSFHGGDPYRIECDTDDDGSLEIPMTLIDQLLGYEYGGFPGLNLARRAANSVAGPDGCIEFGGSSSVNRHPVVVEGEISCNPTEPGVCPEGLACSSNWLCRPVCDPSGPDTCPDGFACGMGSGLCE